MVGERGPSTWRIFSRGYTCAWWDSGQRLVGHASLPLLCRLFPADTVAGRVRARLRSFRFQSPGPRTISSTFPARFVLCGDSQAQQWRTTRRSSSVRFPSVSGPGGGGGYISFLPEQVFVPSASLGGVAPESRAPGEQYAWLAVITHPFVHGQILSPCLD